MSEAAAGRVYFEVACRHDIGDMAQLAAQVLPDLTHLTTTEAWADAYRFGAGTHPRDACLLTARHGVDGPLLGFVWADAAMFIDEGVPDPWWCLNAVAVTPGVRRHGLGRALVAQVLDRARAAGVVSVYGLCYRISVPFWQAQGFQVSMAGGSLEADALSDLGDRGTLRVNITDQSGGHVFVRDVPQVNDDRSARLRLVTGEIR